MRIAVNTRFLQKNQLEGYGHFINEIFKIIVFNNPQHEFLFIFDRPFSEEFIYSKNITAKIVTPKARHALSFRYWYDVKVPIVLKKWKADVFVSLDGFCSVTTSVPQIVCIHDLAFLHYPKLIAKSHLWYYKLMTPKFLKKASKIVTVSQYSKNDILKQYKIQENKIEVIYSGIRSKFCSINNAEREKTKQLFSNGEEYFLFVGGVHPRKNVMSLIKAFSIFKKWTKSNMKLLVIGRMAWQYSEIEEKLKTYKYRNDVELLGYADDTKLASIMSAAYVLVHPSFFEGFGSPIVEAFHSAVPVLTSNTSSMAEIADDAALLFDPNNIEDLAQQMILIYKDEKLKKQLIEKGIERAKDFSWNKTANKLWECIESVATK